VTNIFSRPGSKKHVLVGVSCDVNVVVHDVDLDDFSDGAFNRLC
jgi:hypothetical protein